MSAIFIGVSRTTGCSFFINPSLCQKSINSCFLSQFLYLTAPTTNSRKNIIYTLEHLLLCYRLTLFGGLLFLCSGADLEGFYGTPLGFWYTYLLRKNNGLECPNEQTFANNEKTCLLIVHKRLRRHVFSLFIEKTCLLIVRSRSQTSEKTCLLIVRKCLLVRTFQASEILNVHIKNRAIRHSLYCRGWRSL